MTVFLVKPHPPAEIMAGACPAPEKYKYAWEPVALKIIASLLRREFPALTPRVWHLIQSADEAPFFDALRREQPDMVIFTESDITVNEVSRIAGRVKELCPSCITAVGGKQSSTLRTGDAFPFRNIDAAFRGGPEALLRYIARLTGKEAAAAIPGEILVDEAGIVRGDNSFGGRPQFTRSFDNVVMRKIPVENVNPAAYITEHQSHPALLAGEVRTSPVYSGEGCLYNCVFCQSPVEFPAGQGPFLCAPRAVAAEIEWLIQEHGANNFFFLEPNLDLENLAAVYAELAARGIMYAAVSGFLRAADIVKYHRQGLLARLAEKGLRVVSVGIDIPLDTRRDVYGKSFSYNAMMEALALCVETGIIVLGTAVGHPGQSAEETAAQLERIKALPLADMDVRLAVAIRNTRFYRANEKYLLHHPDAAGAYFDRQNYRYQTLRFPGKITPPETYALLKEFYAAFYHDERHLSYVRAMLKKHADTQPFFERQYQGAVPV